MLDEEEVLDWLTDPKIMSVSDGIENVNRYNLNHDGINKYREVS